MVRWAPIVIFPDPVPSAATRLAPVGASEEQGPQTGLVYAYWFEDAGPRVVKVGRTVNWKMRERNIFDDILHTYDTLPRVFAVRGASDLTASEDALVDRMSADARFRLYRGIEWFSTALDAWGAEQAVLAHLDACVR